MWERVLVPGGTGPCLFAPRWPVLRAQGVRPPPQRTREAHWPCLLQVLPSPRKGQKAHIPREGPENELSYPLIFSYLIKVSFSLLGQQIMKGEAASLDPSLTPPNPKSIKQPRHTPSHRQIHSQTFLHAFTREDKHYTQKSGHTRHMAL